MPARSIQGAVRRRDTARPHRTLKISAMAIWPGALLLPVISATAQTAASPEAVLITARPPDPVGNAAFSTVVIDPVQLQTMPKLDQALRQIPALQFFRDNSSLSAFPARVGVSLR